MKMSSKASIVPLSKKFETQMKVITARSFTAYSVLEPVHLAGLSPNLIDGPIMGSGITLGYFARGSVDSNGYTKKV